MSTQSKRGAAQSQDRHDTAGPTSTPLAHMARQQLAAQAEQMATLFCIQEHLLQAQLHMGQRVALMHRQAAENFRQADTAADLATLQSTLLVYGWQETMRWWQEMLLAGGRAGSSALAAARAAADAQPAPSQAPAPTVSPAAQAMEAAITAAAPMADAFQQMFTAPFRPSAPH